MAELLARLLPGAVDDPISPTTTLLCILPLRACCKNLQWNKSRSYAYRYGKTTGKRRAVRSSNCYCPRTAADVVFLCSDAASYLTDAAIPVNGGWVAG